MQIEKRRIHTGKIPYLWIYMIGLILGIIVMNGGRSLLLDHTGLLDEYSLYQMKYMSVNNSALFVYVFSTRMKSLLMIAIMATTYLGLLVTGGMIFWYGISSGMFLSAVIIRYGIKGILFALTGIFPQFLFYIPAIAFLAVWCEQTCRSIYFHGGIRVEVKKMIPQKLVQLVIICFIMMVGCALESYINPFFVTKLLKIF
ncbi:stage II sporulation protein M [Lachnospiraceae bacterium OttesenSCG-928-D06]|nr:stage II sporulation protein M [Lachnospiraceae bacterium OttesenSCG-928-D06]